MKSNCILAFVAIISLSSIGFGQKELFQDEIDSIVITHMPLNSRVSFTHSEKEFRISNNNLKKFVVMKQQQMVDTLSLEIEGCMEDTLELNQFDVLALFDFYSGDELVETFQMNSVGIIRLSSLPNFYFYCDLLNKHFRNLTGQTNVKCSP